MLVLTPDGVDGLTAFASELAMLSGCSSEGIAKSAAKLLVGVKTVIADLPALIAALDANLSAALSAAMAAME